MYKSTELSSKALDGGNGFLPGVETAHGYVVMEVKNRRRWEKKFNRGLHRLSEEFGRNKVASYGVFQGERLLMIDTVIIYPALDFLKRLWSGEILNE